MMIKVIEKKISDLKPYKKNPRENDAAVPYVANSIREFGFKVPIVIDKNNEIIAGHTRLKAAKQLGLTKLPCVIADDLSPEQVRAFRLADNKVAEKAMWNFDRLSQELDDLDADIDMEQFGFDLDDYDVELDLDDDNDGYYGDERERTFNRYNLEQYDPDSVEGFYQMPKLDPCSVVPDKLIGFNYVLSSNDVDAGVHFFIDDYQFERIWDRPEFYIDKLSKFQCVLTPDFSLYMDMPMAMKIWNVFRSRLIGQMMQREHIAVIPTLSWAEPETFDFCFDGIGKGGTVAVSTVGVMKDNGAIDTWRAGMDEAIKRIHPKTIVCYGAQIDYDFKSAKVKYIAARNWENSQGED